MSRPTKQGLDYFPMDVNVDEKIELIEAKHGISGFGILIKLYQKIYKEGYFIHWNEESSLLFSKRINVDINEVNDIINDCFKYQLFDESIHKKYTILTSTGIQKRYLNAVERRKEVELIKEYIIINKKEINANINWINVDSSTQSKVKEIKEENSMPSKSANFLDKIINTFVEEHGSYEVIAIGKERNMARKLLTKYQEFHPKATGQEVLDGLRIYFKQCINIEDPWLRDNMSIPIIINQFNQINKIIKYGKSTRKKGATVNEIADAVAEVFAINSTGNSEEYEKH